MMVRIRWPKLSLRGKLPAWHALQPEIMPSHGRLLVEGLEAHENGCVEAEDSREWVNCRFPFPARENTRVF